MGFRNDIGMKKKKTKEKSAKQQFRQMAYPENRG